jgi:fructose-1-phosphate kinase PfkB-like protein
MLVLGLNPAYQKVVKLGGALQVGEVNRATAVQAGVGGKGQNCGWVSQLVG